MEGKAMMGRGSSSTVDRAKGGAAEAGATMGDKAAETVSELAERAAEIATRAAEAAREARKTAEPVIRSAAEKAAERASEARKQAEPVLRSAAEKAAEQLSDVAERAAEVLADTAERLAAQGAEKGAEASVAAREKLADATEKLAESVRPKKKRRGRRVLVFGAITGGAVAVAMSPLGQKIRSRISGGGEDTPEPPSITLPVQRQAGTPPESVATAQGPAAATSPKGAPAEADSVLAGRPVPPKSAGGDEPAAES